MLLNRRSSFFGLVLLKGVPPPSDKIKRLGAHSAHQRAKRSGALGAQRELCGWAVVDNWRAAREALVAKALKRETRGKMSIERRSKYAGRFRL